MVDRLKLYYSLTKPRVLYGNVLTAVAGFLLAAGHYRRFNWLLFVATIAGMSLVIAAACVLNNVLDQDIDLLMERTKTRAVASGQLPSLKAVAFGTVLGLLGMAILALGVNGLVVIIGGVGFVTYVWLYGVLSKRRSIHGTLVGSISGALPILAGYCAVADKIDAGAALVFLALFFWQFPEFYSIAIYRLSEYKAAKIPVMPAVIGIKQTKPQIVIYTGLFIVAALLLTPLGYTGWVYFVVMTLIGLAWLQRALAGLTASDDDAWARQMFRFSMIIILVLSVMLSVGGVLP